MIGGDWKAAECRITSSSTLRCHTGNGDSRFSLEWKNLEQLARDGLNRPAKSQALAGILSAILPGSGKLYCGRKYDALYTLCVLTSSAWLSYRGFRDDGIESIKGWSFGVLTAFFYGGNIYGSCIAANIYNEKVEQALHNRMGFAVRYWIWF